MANANSYPRVADDFKHKIQVKLCWYRKHGENLVGEEELNLFSLHDLQDIFDVYINNAYLNCWHVKTRQAKKLQRITSHNIEINKYTYFVEQEADYNKLEAHA